MSERDSKISGLEEDVTKIDFPRLISEHEAEELLKYFTAQMDEPNGSKLSVSVHYEQNRHYRDAFSESTTYERIEQVPVKKGDTKITGTIRRVSPLESAQFQFRFKYDGHDRPSFEGIDFFVTPGYEPGKLSSDNINLMRNMKKYVGSYFEKENKR